MAFVGSYSVPGLSQSITKSNEYSTLDELLLQIPDNTQNLITPGDLRDSVYTLWQQIGSVGVIAASAASASALYTNTNPSTVAVGGFPLGTTFPTNQTMQQMWDQLLYPYILPGASLSISGGVVEREYGDPNALSNNSVNLIWSVVQNTSTVGILTINVDGVPQVATGASQTGTKLTFATHSWNTSNVSETCSFNMSVVDNLPSTVTASVDITFMNAIYWGKINLSSISNPNLTFNPASASLVATLCTDGLIQVLSGAGVTPGYDLSTTKSMTLNGIDGGGQYLIFAWPSSLTGANTPTFYVNGFISTAFTRVRTASPFVNQYGFTTNYEVWVSNTIQNSPLNIQIT